MFVVILSCDCSQSIYHKTKKGVIPSEITPFNFIYLSSGEPTRTTDLWVMSPTSYHCSIPQYVSFKVSNLTALYHLAQCLDLVYFLNAVQS